MICAVHAILVCDAIETMYVGPYSEAYLEWAELVQEHPYPVDTVVLTTAGFYKEDLRKITDLTLNTDILEIG